MRRFLVPVILPLACAWVRRQEGRILRDGVPLNSTQMRDAHAIGVLHPERVRVLHVSTVPLPGSWFAGVAQYFGGTSFRDTSGLSAQYGIFIRARFAADRQLLAHELTHTHQYQRMGGIRPFLRQYLHECLTVGYLDAEMEREARVAAQRVCAAG
jgi:hypothetical protein